MSALRGQVVKGAGSIGLLCLLLIACSNSVISPTPTPTENTYGFSQAAFNTLNSLEMIDEYPLYTMNYEGGYDNLGAGVFPPQYDFACSLFAAMGNPGELLYGRNFDWSYSPALLLFTDPPGGYASVSMVSLGFLNSDTGNYQDLLMKSIPEREALLYTPFIPIDGMNEQGLAIGMASIMESVAGSDPLKPTISSLGIMREILDHAASIAEAVDIFQQYNIDFVGRPPVHYLVADSKGTSVVVEYIAGEMVVLFNEEPWQIATNHLLGIDGPAEGGSSWRYDQMENRLLSSGGIMTEETSMELLSDVSQRFNGTQWSIVYDTGTGNILLVMERNYDVVHRFQLEMEAR